MSLIKKSVSGGLVNVSEEKGYQYAYTQYLVNRYNEGNYGTNKVRYEDIIATPDFLGTFAYLLARCPKKRAEVILKARFGEQKTFREIGESLGVTLERVRELLYAIDRHFTRNMDILAVGLEYYFEKSIANAIKDARDEAYGRGYAKGREETLRTIKPDDKPTQEKVEKEITKLTQDVFEQDVLDFLNEGNASLRLYNCVRGVDGIKTAGDLFARFDKDDQRWHIRRMGKVSTRELKSIFSSHGIELPSKYE